MNILKRFINFSIKIENIQNCTTLFSSELEQIIIDKTDEYYNSIVSKEYNCKNYIDYLTWGIESFIKEEQFMSLLLPKNTMNTILSNIKNITFFNNSKDIIDRDNSLKYFLHTGDIKVLLIKFRHLL